MKKIFCILLSFLIIIACNPLQSAAMQSDSKSGDTYCNTVIVCQNNDITVECTLIIETTSNIGIQPFATSHTKTASKKYDLKNSAGSIVASYTLTGTFTYNGITSSCTAASCSTSINNNAWKFTSKTASKSGNKAIGSFTAECSTPSQTISKSMSITCSKDGIIS